MRRKILALFGMLSLLLYSIPVQAANNLPISFGNSYTAPTMGGGTYEYTVPFTGYYDITLSGAQGASYDSNCGGCGITLSGKMLLSYGDVLKFDVSGVKPSYVRSGSVITVPAGQAATLSINGDVVWKAIGGPGQRNRKNAEVGVTSVVLYGSDGSTETCTVHWCPNTTAVLYQLSSPGECYTATGHTHDKTAVCPACTHYHPAVECGHAQDYYDASTDSYRCPYHGGDSNAGISGCTYVIRAAYYEHDRDCDHAQNTWTYTCRDNSKIFGAQTAGYGNCYVADGYTADSVVSNTSGCKATIQLAEQQHMFYDSELIDEATWQNIPLNLVVKDNAVCYYKRR